MFWDHGSPDYVAYDEHVAAAGGTGRALVDPGAQHHDAHPLSLDVGTQARLGLPPPGAVPGAGPVKDAVQPGRGIATVRGLGTALAVMSRRV